MDYLELVSNQEYYQRYLIYYLINNYSVKELDNLINKTTFPKSYNWFKGERKPTIIYYIKGDSYTDKKNKFLKIYQKMVENKNEYLNKYKSRYLVSENKNLNFPKVYENKQLVIYRLFPITN